MPGTTSKGPLFIPQRFQILWKSYSFYSMLEPMSIPEMVDVVARCMLLLFRAVTHVCNSFSKTELKST